MAMAGCMTQACLINTYMTSGRSRESNIVSNIHTPTIVGMIRDYTLPAIGPSTGCYLGHMTIFWNLHVLPAIL